MPGDCRLPRDDASLSCGAEFLRLLARFELSRPCGAETRSESEYYPETGATHKLRGETYMPTGTVKLHRVLRAPPERVYRAFIDAGAMAKWLPPYGFTCTVHHMDPKVGGSYKMSFTNFTTGRGHSFGGEYLELSPHEKLRYTDQFDDPNLPGEMQTTVSLTKVACGTELNVTQAGIPEVIPLEMCYLGWQESLAQLATLVEPEIPD